VAERFKPMEIAAGAEEGNKIKVVLEGLAETELELGRDIEKGQMKTIMTLFAYGERVKPLSIMHAAAAGTDVTVSLWKTQLDDNVRGE
ncbi:MAG: hypothetical protein MUO90_03330, partial [Dehalococcoidales bacterium]|nr:hypothetical protein [Dehalococcoidales bacterium]